MTTSQVLITIVALLVIAAIGYGIWFVTRRRALQHRFGPEYDRAVAEGDSRIAVERELRERERRHAELELRELAPEARARYAASWQEIQSRFLDDPTGAVRDADALVTELIGERGYPAGDYDEQVARLSVEHARTLGHYRDAHEISLISDRGEATTEQLRQAVVHYRTLFSDLLGEEVGTASSATASRAATPATGVTGHDAVTTVDRDAVTSHDLTSHDTAAGYDTADYDTAGRGAVADRGADDTADHAAAAHRDANARQADRDVINRRDDDSRDTDLRDAGPRDADLRDGDLRDGELRDADRRDADVVPGPRDAVDTPQDSRRRS